MLHSLDECPEHSKLSSPTLIGSRIFSEVVRRHFYLSSGMIAIRALTVKDAPLLAKIGGISLLESHGHSAPGEIMQAYVDRSFSEASCRQELEDPENVFFLISHNGVAAGYYKIIAKSPYEGSAEEEVTKLERLYLLKSFYGLSLGEKLMTHAIDQSKLSGDKGMWLNVWKGNERALRFYRKHGFEVIGESKFVLTSTHSNPNWVMALNY